MLRLMVATWSRRRSARHVVALGAGAALVLCSAACTGGSTSPTDTGTGSPSPTASSGLARTDAQAVGRTTIREAKLAATVQGDLDRFGRRVAALRPVVAALYAHVAALQRAAGVEEGPLLSPTPPPAVTPAGAVRRTALALDAAALAAARPTVDQLAPVGGPVAGLLASVAASDTALAAVLRGTGGGAPTAGPAATASTGSSVDALQAALTGEYAAVYAYGVVGGQLAAHGAPTSELDQARSGLDTHVQRRDRLIVMIQAAGGAADPGAGGYALAFPVDSAASARRLAGLVEARCAGNYAQLVVGARQPAARRESVSWLRDAAVRQSGWTAVAPALPGLQPPPPTS